MNDGTTFFATARTGNRQAFVTGQNYSYGGGNDESAAWRIYAFTDRPAYRPKETVNWKFIARRYNGSVYSTPSEQTIQYEIWRSARDESEIGSDQVKRIWQRWGTLDLTEQMPLGEYQVRFWNLDA